MPINEPYNPLSDVRLNPLARKNSDIVKRFVSPSSSVSGGGNGVTSLEDPTYLGFSLRFDISSPLFNGASNSSLNRPPSENPVFSELAGFAAGRGLGGAIEEPRLSGEVIKPVSGNQSAVGYLEKIGETTRANYLKAFIQGIREINEFRPYYWQTIDGLTNAWSKSLNMTDPYSGSADSNEGITIGCLEAIDLKISALFSLYKAAVYDLKHKRLILPRNLMYFNIYVDVHEIRKFKSTQTWLAKLNLSKPQDDVERYLNDNTSKITFLFDDCVWVPAESGKVFENVTNAGENSVAVTSMKWEYSMISIQSDFAGIDQELNDKSMLQSKGSLGSAIKDATKNQAIKASNAVLNRIESRIRGGVQSLVLGNAFGLGNQILSFIRDPGALASAIEGSVFQQNRNRTPLPSQRLGDNVIGNSVGVSPQLSTDNIFAGRNNISNAAINVSNLFGVSPSGPPPLNSNNVFEQ
jgi:hypothetical protein